MTPRTYTIGKLLRAALIFLSLGMLLACAGPSNRQNRQLADATREIGEAYMRQGDFTAALRELLKAEQLNPQDPYVHNNLGLCYMARNRIPNAITHFQKAVTLKPTYTPAHNNLGSAYLLAREWDAAIAVFKEITKDVLYATPHYPLVNLGKAYYEKGDYPTALHYYREALKLQPGFVVAHNGAGRTFLAMNQARPAVNHLEAAVRQAPQVAEYHFDLAEAYLLTGNLPQARASYQTVIDLSAPESALARQAGQRLESVR